MTHPTPTLTHWHQKITSRPLWRNTLVFLFFCLLTAIAGWRVLSQLDTVLIGYDNDVYINPWADWWTRKALTDSALTLWRTDWLFYPNGANLSYHSFSHLNTAVSLALRPLFGTLPAYNLAILLNYPLIGLAMYQLVRYLTRSEISGLLGGIAFAFSSQVMYQSSHPVLLSIYCFPWATLYLLRAIDEERRVLAVVAGIFVFLGTATSTLLFFMMLLWFAFLIAYLWLTGERKRPARSLTKRPSLPIILTFALTSGLLTLPLLFPLLQDALSNQNSSFVISDSRESIVADILAPLVPHWFLWFWRGLYFGIVALYLLLFSRQSGHKIRLWVMLLIGAYLISIGPHPQFLGRPLNITLPWSLPFVPILRNMYRFNILMSFALSVLVGYGWLGMRQQLKTARAQQIGALIMMALLFADYATPQIPVVPAAASSFYTDFLADAPTDSVLTLLPTNRQYDKVYMYFQTLHGRKMTNGVISRPETDTFDFAQSNALLNSYFTPETPFLPMTDLETAVSQLATSGVDYLIFNKEFMDDEQIVAWQTAVQLPIVYEDRWLFAYALHDEEK